MLLVAVYVCTIAGSAGVVNPIIAAPSGSRRVDDSAKLARDCDPVARSGCGLGNDLTIVRRNKLFPAVVAVVDDSSDKGQEHSQGDQHASDAVKQGVEDLVHDAEHSVHCGLLVAMCVL